MENKNTPWVAVEKNDCTTHSDPVGELLLNTFVDQINEFLNASPEERGTLCKDLFSVGTFPARLTGCEGAEKYLVYQLERYARMKKVDPLSYHRMSTALILIDKNTHKPSYYLTAYITKSGDGSVIVYPMNDNGPVYKNIIQWDTRFDCGSNADE